MFFNQSISSYLCLYLYFSYSILSIWCFIIAYVLLFLTSIYHTTFSFCCFFYVDKLLNVAISVTFILVGMYFLSNNTGTGKAHLHTAPERN